MGPNPFGLLPLPLPRAAGKRGAQGGGAGLPSGPAPLGARLPAADPSGTALPSQVPCSAAGRSWVPVIMTKRRWKVLFRGPALGPSAVYLLLHLPPPTGAPSGGQCEEGILKPCE